MILCLREKPKVWRNVLRKLLPSLCYVVVPCPEVIFLVVWESAFAKSGKVDGAKV